MSEFVFKVDYSCSNCGNEWAKRYPEKLKVEYGTTRRRVVERDKSEPRGTQTSIVTCPICGLRGGIVINDRSPIDD